MDSDEDVKEMYTYLRKLWCHVALEDGKNDQSRKGSGPPDRNDPYPKRALCAQKLTDVEEIVSVLKPMHGNEYPVEKLNAWTHMIHHNSRDSPPDLPYFRGARKTNKQENKYLSEVHAGMSPGKRIGLRTVCIDQLQKWHCLLEMCAITQSRYDEWIMGDIVNLLLATSCVLL